MQATNLGAKHRWLGLAMLSVAIATAQCSNAVADETVVATTEAEPEAKPVVEAVEAVGQGTSLTLIRSPAPLVAEPLPVSALAMSTKSDRLASGGDVSGGASGGTGPGIVRVWDVKQLTEVVSYPTERGVRSVAISPDGRLVAWSSWARDVVVRVVDGEELLREQVGWPAKLTFSPDGKLLVAATEGQKPNGGQKLLTWNMESGKSAGEFQGETSAFEWLGISPDGKVLVGTGGAAGQPFQGTAWDVETRQQRYRLQWPTGPISGSAISPDSETLFTCDSGTICLWELSSGKKLRMFNPHVQVANAAARAAKIVPGGALAWQCMALSPDGLLGASAGTPDGGVMLWESLLGKPAGMLRGYGAPVRGLAFTHDGKTLITGSDDHSIRLWNVETKEQTAALQSPRDEGELCLAVAYSPDGGSVASGLADGRIRVVGTGPLGPLHSWQAHGDSTASVAYSPDGRLLASGGFENTVKIWNPATGELVQTLAGHQGWNVALAFSPDGRTLASGGYDRTILLWNVADGKQQAKLSGHAGPVRALAFSHDGALLASGSADGTVRLWNVAGGREQTTLSDHKGVVRAVAFSPDDRLLASGGEDRVVRVWNVESHDVQSRLEKHSDVVTALAFIDGGLVSAGSDRSLAVWNVATGKLLAERADPTPVVAMSATRDGKRLITSHSNRTLTAWEAVQAESTSLATFGKFESFPWSAVFSPDGASLVLATGGVLPPGAAVGPPPSVPAAKRWGLSLYRYNVATGEEQFHVGLPGNARSIDFAPQGDLLAVGLLNGGLSLFDATTGNPRAALENGGGSVNCVRFSADGKWLFTATMDKNVRIYEIAGRTLVTTLRGHSDMVMSLALSPDAKELVSGGRDGTAIVWDLATHEPRRTFPFAGTSLASVAWSLDGKTIATGGNFGAVKLWQAQTGEAVGSLAGDQGLVYGIDFSPDGKWLAATGEDNTTRLWNLPTGEAPRILAGHSGPVTSARFSPDGKTLVTTSMDGTARLWAVAPAAK